MIIPTASEKSTPKRPPPSPLLLTWTQHLGQVEQAIDDAATTLDDGRAIKATLHAASRGQVDPDTLGLRRFWAFASMAGHHRLLDEQRAWHAEYGMGVGV